MQWQLLIFEMPHLAQVLTENVLPSYTDNLLVLQSPQNSEQICGKNWPYQQSTQLREHPWEVGSHGSHKYAQGNADAFGRKNMPQKGNFDHC